MQHHEIIQVLQDNDTFLITYYAKKYQAIIRDVEHGLNPTQIQKANTLFLKEMIFCLLGFRCRTK